jgi:hypothetical protein
VTCGSDPLGFCVSVHSAGVEVLCFDTDLEVFISLELETPYGYEIDYKLNAEKSFFKIRRSGE